MLKNFKIRNKLIVLILPLLLFIGLVGWIGMQSMREANDSLATIYNDRVVCLAQLSAVRDAYAIKMSGAARKLAAKQISAEEALKSFEEGREMIDKIGRAHV